MSEQFYTYLVYGIAIEDSHENPVRPEDVEVHGLRLILAGGRDVKYTIIATQVILVELGDIRSLDLREEPDGYGEAIISAIAKSLGHPLLHPEGDWEPNWHLIPHVVMD